MTISADDGIRLTTIKLKSTKSQEKSDIQAVNSVFFRIWRIGPRVKGIKKSSVEKGGKTTELKHHPKVTPVLIYRVYRFYARLLHVLVTMEESMKRLKKSSIQESYFMVF
jgi:hypothetical protein